MRSEAVDRIHMAYGKDQSQACVNTVMYDTLTILNALHCTVVARPLTSV